MKKEVHRVAIRPVDGEGRMGLFLDGERVLDEELEEALERCMRPIEADESEYWAEMWKGMKEFYMAMFKLSSFERFQLLMQMGQLPEE